MITTKPKPTPPTPLGGNTVRDAHYARENRAMDEMATLAKNDSSGLAADIFMAFVVEAAVFVLRTEHGRGGVVTPYVARARAHYVTITTKAREALGDERFDEMYKRRVAEHNARTRSDLDRANGATYAFVLPTFNPDGTHEPLGPKDFPWATGW